MAPRQVSWAGVPGNSRVAVGASSVRARAGGCGPAGSGRERLPAGRRVGARHLLSCHGRLGASWRRRIHPDLLGEFRARVIL